VPATHKESIMNTHKRIGFGRFFLGSASVAAIAGATGCASSGGFGGHDSVTLTAAQLTLARPAGVRVGAARVVDAHVNPQVPVRLTIEGEQIAVRFGHSRSVGAIAHLDRRSLDPVRPESHMPAEPPEAPSTEAVRAALTNGRFIVCWKSGDFEQGYRIMAQAWSGSGEALGAPVTISPIDADVLGTPQVVSLDRGRAVVTFATLANDRAELLAVSLQAL
jgi:hypothetical protein